MPASRRLHFVVGTSLLGASLALGCAGSKKGTDPELHVNPGPDTGADDSATAPVDADAGEVEDPDQPDAPDQPDPPDQPEVGGPSDKPEILDVNPGPQEPPKHVNTRPADPH